MSLTLHHLEFSRSRRIMWLFEELELEYEVKHYSRNPKTFRAPPELRKIHPLGKVPIVTDGEKVLVETGAMFEQLLETYANGRLQPEAGTEAAWQYKYFMHYAEASLMPPLLIRLIMSKVRSAKMPFFIKPIARGIVDKVESGFTAGELRLHTSYLDGILSEQPWFTGQDFTAADIMMSYPVEALVARGQQPDGTTTHLRDWVKRIRARPGYQRAMDRGAGEAVT